MMNDLNRSNHLMMTSTISSPFFHLFFSFNLIKNYLKSPEDKLLEDELDDEGLLFLLLWSGFFSRLSLFRYLDLYLDYAMTTLGIFLAFVGLTFMDSALPWIKY